MEKKIKKAYVSEETEKKLKYIAYKPNRGRPTYLRIDEIGDLLVLIERAKAKCPHLEGDGYSDGCMVYDTWVCPNCDEHYEVDYDHYDYCPKCGQHIDWSQIKDE